MAQAGYTPIQLYHSTTASAVPSAGNLANGEPALNITDGKLYYKNNSGVVTLLASADGASGNVVGPASSTDNALVRFDTTTGKLVQNSVGILDDSGNLTGIAALTTSGALTLNGGTANGVAYLNGSKVLTTGSALTFDGTNLGVAIGGAGTAPIDVASNGSAVGVILRGRSADNIGTLEFKSNDGATVRAQIQSRGDEFRILSAGNVPQTYYVNGAEQMRLTSTGLGIGQSNPTAKLQVKGGTTIANLGDWNSKSNSMFELANPAVRFGIGYDSSDQVLLQAFDASNAARLLCLQGYGGNVGIGSNAVPSVGSTVVLGVGGANGGTLAVLQSGNIVYRTSASTSGVDFFNPNASPMQWYTAGTSRMVLDASGRLVVGAASTAAKFQVSGASANTYMLIDNAAGGENYFAANVSNIFQTAGAERARIDSSGNLLVGTTDGSTGNKLAINGSMAFINGASIPQVNYYSSASTIEFVNRNSGGSKTFSWYYQASGAGSPATLSTSGVWTNASDARGKENIADIHYGLDTVMALQPRQYDVKSDGSHAVGFVAQEVLPVVPELVHVTRRTENDEFYGLDYGSMTAVLVKAIQEQQAIITALTARVAALESN